MATNPTLPGGTGLQSRNPALGVLSGIATVLRASQ